MATTFKSDIITNRDNLDIQNIQQADGKENVITAHILTGGAVADNDVIVMAEIPVNASITSIRMWSDDLGSAGDFNLGFYEGVRVAADVVVADAIDEDALGTAIDVNAAALADVEVRFEVQNISTQGDEAWRLAGLSEQPDYGTFFICFTASEATIDTGDVILTIRYLN